MKKLLFCVTIVGIIFMVPLFLQSAQASSIPACDQDPNGDGCGGGGGGGGSAPLAPSGSQTITITINDMNRIPVVADILDQDVDVDQQLVVSISATDLDCPDGSCIVLSYSAVPATGFGVLTDNHNGTGSLTFNPGSSDVGDFNVTVTATDNGVPPASGNDSFVLHVHGVQQGNCPSHNPGSIDINGSGSFALIQQAIDAASSGDTINVGPGTYAENLDFKGKNITVKSTSGSAATIIDGCGLDTTVKFMTNETSSAVFDGFTVTNGRGNSAQGGGINVSNTASPTIRNAVIVNNQSEFGGGIRISNTSTSPTITNTTVSNNFINTSNGLGAGIAIFAGSPTITDTTVSGNYATVDGVDGAGVYINGAGASATVLDQVTITGNSASSVGGDGGGIFVSVASPTIRNSFIQSNTANLGGGVLIQGLNSSPVFNNVDISNNTAISGGGIYADAGSRPQISNCTFTNNHAINPTDTNSGGGGLFLNSVDPGTSIANSDFTSNTATANPGTNGGRGAGIHSVGSNFTLTGGNVSNNSSQKGGALYLDNGSSPTITGTSFVANHAVYGGGAMYIRRNSSPVINNVLIKDNVVDEPVTHDTDGAAIYCYDNCDAIINNSVIDHNINADASVGNGGDGGGLYIRTNSDPQITNTLIINNRNHRGGGLIASDNSFPVITNCTIANNVAAGLWDDYGGGIDVHVNSQPTVENTVLWGNEPDQINIYDATASIVINYSNIQGAWAGTGNVSNDPLFVDPASGDFSLNANSPSIDSANGNVDPVTDMTGLPRYDDPNMPNTGTGTPNYVDMGPYERQVSSINLPPVIQPLDDQTVAVKDVVVVPITATDPNGNAIDLSCSGCADTDITEFLDNNDGTGSIAIHPRTWHVGLHSYTIRARDNGTPNLETTVQLNVTVTPEASMPVKVYDAQVGGNFVDQYPTIQSAIDAATTLNGYRIEAETQVYNENVDFHGKNVLLLGLGGDVAPTIDGGSIAPVVSFVSGETSGAILDGFNIVNGLGTGMNGGGITITNGSQPVIRNCNISNNRADSGGGILVQGATTHPTIMNTSISSNSATATAAGQGGGGIRSFSPITLTNVSFTGNSTAANGGGLYMTGDGPSSVLDHLTFTGNTASSQSSEGGGAFITSANLTIKNSMFNYNQSVLGGGISIWQSSSAVLTNCLLFANNASSHGSAVYMNASTVNLINNTIANNTAPGTGSYVKVYSGSLTAVNNIIWDSGSQEIVVNSGATAQVSYSTVRGGYAGTGNLATDPLFVNVTQQNYSLSSNSPAIDSANGNVSLATDFAGNSRYDDPGMPNLGISAVSYVDRGALERQAASAPQPLGPVNVYDTLLTGGNFVAAYSTIQAAIDATSTLNNYRLEVFPGTYTENINTRGKILRIYSKNNNYNEVIISAASAASVLTVGSAQGGSPIFYLEGLTISGGSATIGGGINSSMNLNIKNCKLLNNRAADKGGAVYMALSTNLTIENSLVTDNRSDANAAKGGAIYLSSGVSTISQTEFHNNWTELQGGAIWNGGSLSVTGSLFDGNYVDISGNGNKEGGAIYAAGNMNLSQTTFQNNNGPDSGGAIFIKDDAYLTVTADHSNFFNNTSLNTGSSLGGAIAIRQYDSFVGTNVVFRGNRASLGGAIGGLGLGNSLNLSNSEITKNTATKGGAIKMDGVNFNGNLSLSHVTLADNITTNTNNTGAVHTGYVFHSSRNAIFSNPGSPVDIFRDSNSGGGIPAVNYSLVRNASSNFSGSNNLLGVDPQFLSPVSDDYHLQGTSPAIDAGDPNTSNDPDGTRADMGAYWATRTPPSGPVMLYDTSNKTNILGAFNNIQPAISAAVSGNYIEVNDGTYTETINYLGKNILIKSINGPAAAMIDAAGSNSRVVTVNSGETSAVLDGFTVKNGSGVSDGGGAWISNGSSLTIKNCVIRNNSASTHGGGIAVDGTSASVLMVQNSTISQNTVPLYGGGMFSTGSAAVVTVSNSVIENNSANVGAGFMASSGGNYRLDNTIVRNNSSTESGGGIHISGMIQAELDKMLVYGNTAPTGGGVHLVVPTEPTTTVAIRQSTIVNNSATGGSGGGVKVEQKVNVTIDSTIIYGNSATTTGTKDLYFSNHLGTKLVQYSDLTYGGNLNNLGTGNVSLTPGFVNTASDFHLVAGSPMIDAGNPDLDGDGSTYLTDIDDRDPDGTRADIGCYYQSAAGSGTGGGGGGTGKIPAMME